MGGDVRTGVAEESGQQGVSEGLVRVGRFQNTLVRASRERQRPASPRRAGLHPQAPETRREARERENWEAFGGLRCPRLPHGSGMPFGRRRAWHSLGLPGQVRKSLPQMLALTPSS